MNHRTGSYLLCKHCGNPFYVHKCRLKRRGKRAPKYCSESCRSYVASVKHGHARSNQKTPTYYAWKGMLARVRENADSKHRRLYYESGITVCRRWLKFQNFLADMREKPAGLSLERRNNKKGYSPRNCYWATQTQQMRNTRSNRMISYAGKTQCVTAWAEETKLKESTIRRRLNSGWLTEKALTTPTQSFGSRDASWRKAA